MTGGARVHRAAASRQVRVLHLGRFFPPRGGVEAHAVSLMTSMQGAMRVDNLVAGDRPPGGFTDTDEGFRVYFARSFGNFASTAIAPGFPLLLRKLSRNYDIIHVHLPDPLSVVSCLLLPSSVPIVATWHSDVIRQKRMLWLYQPFVDRLLKRVKFLIAPTPKHLETSTQLYACDEGRRRVVLFGIKEDRVRVSPDIQGFIDHWKKNVAGKKIIFAVGRHVYYKGFEYLVHAMHSVDPHAVLVLAGAGPLTEKYRSLACQSGLEKRIVFPGRISDEELIALMHACEVFCMPSVERSEAFGLVQLDAMACGKPVVCCELNNGVTYVNQHEKSGLVVPPKDSVALSDAINRLLRNDGLRRRLGQWGRNRVFKEFRHDVMVRETMDLYNEALQ